MNSSLTSTPPLAFPVLVVIPCLNEAAHIDNLVAEMLRQIAGSGSRIVIADGGSTDGTVDLARQAAARHPEVTYMHNPKRIQSAAANLAVEQYGSDYEFWLRIDAHADYPADFIAALTQEAAQSGASSIVVPMETIGKTPRQQAIAAAQNSRLGNGGSQHRQGSRGKGSYVDHGHHALMRISAFLEVGGYDESFSHNEDAELDVRLGRAGHRIWLTGDTCMTYYPRAAFLPLARQYVGYGAGRARTLLKHRIRPRLRQVLPALLLPASLPALLAPVSPVLSMPFGLWMIGVLILGAAASRQAPETRSLAGAAAVIWAVCIMHMAWSAGFCRSLASRVVGRKTVMSAQRGGA